MGLSHSVPNIKFAPIAGGAAGNHTVTGITTNDYLLAVLRLDFTDASETFDDLTSEFTITAANTINNTGGSVSTGGFLFVIYAAAAPGGPPLNLS